MKTPTLDRTDPAATDARSDPRPGCLYGLSLQLFVNDFSQVTAVDVVLAQP